MPYKLKPGQESFEIMGGPDEGKQFTRGRGYQTVPAGYEDRFEEIKAEGGRLKTEGKTPSAPFDKSPPGPPLIKGGDSKKKPDAPEEITPSAADEKDRL